MTTAEAIAQRLGLQDFRTFRQEATWRNADTRFKYGNYPIADVLHRCQGHTTRIILAGLAHLMDTKEPIMFIGHNLNMAKIMGKWAGDWALQLGLDPRRINWATPRSKAASGLRDDQVFTDHVVYEFPDAV